MYSMYSKYKKPQLRKFLRSWDFNMERVSKLLNSYQHLQKIEIDTSHLINKIFVIVGNEMKGKYGRLYTLKHIKERIQIRSLFYLTKILFFFYDYVDIRFVFPNTISSVHKTFYDFLCDIPNIIVTRLSNKENVNYYSLNLLMGILDCKYYKENTEIKAITVKYRKSIINHHKKISIILRNSVSSKSIIKF
jgi:hypothetical protein